MRHTRPVVFSRADGYYILCRAGRGNGTRIDDSVSIGVYTAIARRKTYDKIGMIPDECIRALGNVFILARRAAAPAVAVYPYAVVVCIGKGLRIQVRDIKASVAVHVYGLKYKLRVIRDTAYIVIFSVDGERFSC